MKKLIGRDIKVFVDGIGFIRGKLIREMRDRLIIRGKDDDEPTIIPKSKIGPYKAVSIEDKKQGHKSLMVLGCENPSINCKGVRYVKVGEPSESDFAVFMKQCPAFQESCTSDCIGDIFELPGKALEDLLGGSLFGSYPEEEKVEKEEKSE